MFLSTRFYSILYLFRHFLVDSCTFEQSIESIMLYLDSLWNFSLKQGFPANGINKTEPNVAWKQQSTTEQNICWSTRLYITSIVDLIDDLFCSPSHPCDAVPQLNRVSKCRELGLVPRNTPDSFWKINGKSDWEQFHFIHKIVTNVWAARFGKQRPHGPGSYLVQPVPFLHRLIYAS